jgi:membrane fusion protein (multidrug efflux system)
MSGRSSEEGRKTAQQVRPAHAVRSHNSAAVLRKLVEVGVGGLVLVFAVAWMSGGCGEKIAPDDLAPPTATGGAKSDVVIARHDRVYEQASGTLLSERHTTIASKILARIEEVRVRAGDTVQAGDVVVRLDSRDLGARFAASEQVVTAAEAALVLARSERARVEKLFESGVTTRSEMDRTRRDLDVAISNLEAAEQHRVDAEVGRSHGEIRSPVTGRVVDRLAEPGDTAAPGAPLLRVYDPGSLRLEAPIREGLATRLRTGQPLEVTIASVGLELSGVIDEIVPYAEPGARTFLVKVRVPASPRLYAGMYGRVRVPGGERRRLLVDARAIETIGQLEFVEVVDAEGRSLRRLVTTGRLAEEGRIEVLSGLAEGERVALRM